MDLSSGPIVIEQPPKGVGTINDMWFSWIIDIGFPGTARGEGGKYLIVPPGYEGPLPDSGFFVAHPEPATSYDVELAGQLAAIGIVKGQPFATDARMKNILTGATRWCRARTLDSDRPQQRPPFGRYTRFRLTRLFNRESQTSIRLQAINQQ